WKAIAPSIAAALRIRQAVDTGWEGRFSMISSSGVVVAIAVFLSELGGGLVADLDRLVLLGEEDARAGEVLVHLHHLHLPHEAVAAVHRELEAFLDLLVASDREDHELLVLCDGLDDRVDRGLRADAAQ